MTLSEYLIEAIAKRSSGKYKDFDTIIDKLQKLGFTKVHRLSDMEKQDKTYIRDPRGTTYRQIEVRFGVYRYTINFSNDGGATFVNTIDTTDAYKHYDKKNIDRWLSNMESRL